MKEDKEVIKRCQSGANHMICFDCSEKYIPDGRESYDGTITVHAGLCEICHNKDTVGPSRKLMGFHKMIG